MKISLETIQDLSPDQASLNAAKKLLQPAKWPVLGQDSELRTIWGQCQGSGANPYYTMADLSDYGYKCTCPSRKFPCKHVLALLWQFAEAPGGFGSGESPEWVHDWLGRRRRKSGSINDSDDNADSTGNTKTTTKKNIHLATGDQITPPLSAEQQEKQAAATAKRNSKVREATESQVREGIEELLQWIDDQLRTGVSNLIKEARPRCRQIAARLVDSKATALASRVEEFPAKLSQFVSVQKAQFAFKELGQWILLCEAWKNNPQDPDARRAVMTSEKKDQLLENPDSNAHTGLWEVIGERSEVQRDGLISHSTWLAAIDSQPCKIALLLDFYPVSAKRNQVTMAVGTQLRGTLIYYPSRHPLRALLGRYEILSEKVKQPWQVTVQIPSQHYTDYLTQLPWAERCPCLLDSGHIALDSARRYWWQNLEQTHAIPISNVSLPALLSGTELSSVFLLWNGFHAELLSGQSQKWGSLAC